MTEADGIKNQIISAVKILRSVCYSSVVLCFSCFMYSFKSHLSHSIFFKTFLVFLLLSIQLYRIRTLVGLFRVIFSREDLFVYRVHDLQRKHPKYLVPIFTIIYIINIYIIISAKYSGMPF
jgi:hypothetical protein